MISGVRVGKRVGIAFVLLAGVWNAVVCWRKEPVLRFVIDGLRRW